MIARRRRSWVLVADFDKAKQLGYTTATVIERSSGIDRLWLASSDSPIQNAYPVFPVSALPSVPGSASAIIFARLHYK